VIDFRVETEKRVKAIRELVLKTGAKGIILGNSGGKDSALCAILCKLSCDNTVGVIMPCDAKQNYGQDMDDALLLAEQYGIESRVVDLTSAKLSIVEETEKVGGITKLAASNIPPRLRMTTLYLIAQSEGRLVCGTGNKSERYMGYFTKWGDGGYDFNPIADLYATDIYPFLKYLKAPSSIIEKAPQAGLYEGQTDEKDMGVTYEAIDKFIKEGTGKGEDVKIIMSYHERTHHKRNQALNYPWE